VARQCKQSQTQTDLGASWQTSADDAALRSAWRQAAEITVSRLTFGHSAQLPLSPLLAWCSSSFSGPSGGLAATSLLIFTLDGRPKGERSALSALLWTLDGLSSTGSSRVLPNIVFSSSSANSPPTRLTSTGQLSVPFDRAWPNGAPLGRAALLCFRSKCHQQRLEATLRREKKLQSGRFSAATELQPLADLRAHLSLAGQVFGPLQSCIVCPPQLADHQAGHASAARAKKCTGAQLVELGACSSGLGVRIGKLGAIGELGAPKSERRAASGRRPR